MPTCFWILVVSSPTCLWWKWETAKVARFTAPKIFLGAAKIARFNLYCATKLLGTAKVARFTVPKIFLQDSVFTVRQSFWAAKVARLTVPKNFLGAAKIARLSLYCATKLLGTAKVARFTAPKLFWEQQRLQDSVFTVRQSFWEQQR